VISVPVCLPLDETEGVMLGEGEDSLDINHILRD
jgi:hypothetical protein